MLNLRISSPSDQTDDVLRVLRADPGVSSLAVVRDASLLPVGDLVMADVAREAANDVVAGLRELGIHREGSLHIEPVSTWLSNDGYEADRRTPGSSADSVVWAEVTQRAYEDSELNWTYASFMTLATLIAAIAIVLDSQILVIGAMVLGPEFGAVGARGGRAGPPPADPSWAGKSHSHRGLRYRHRRHHCGGPGREGVWGGSPSKM